MTTKKKCIEGITKKMLKTRIGRKSRIGKSIYTKKDNTPFPATPQPPLHALLHISPILENNNNQVGNHTQIFKD